VGSDSAFDFILEAASDIAEDPHHLRKEVREAASDIMGDPHHLRKEVIALRVVLRKQVLV
jgi:hypothetical protein